MKPCCLNEIESDEYETFCGTLILGGAVGKGKECPKDANEAHDFISNDD